MKAIIIYGAPGAGKGTQANLLADELNAVHFDVGKYLEAVLNNPARQQDPVIQQEKEKFDRGELVSIDFFLNVVKERIKEIGTTRVTLVLSGNPRTIEEGFGLGGIMEDLEQYYGKDQITIFYLNITPELSLLRNTRRLICSVCGRPVLFQEKFELTHCAFCGGPLRKRSLDNPETIKVRLNTFKEKTLPLMEEFRRHGYRVEEVDGDQAPYLVFTEILKRLK